MFLFMSVYAFVCIAQHPAEKVEEPEQSVSTTPDATPPPTSDPRPPPSPQSPDLASVSGPDPSIVSQLEEPGTGRAQGEQGREGLEWKVAAPLEEAPAVVHVPLAVVKLESLLDPTELSTVSAERHRPGSGLPPKQSQSQKQDYPASEKGANECHVRITDSFESCHRCSGVRFNLIRCSSYKLDNLTSFMFMGCHWP